MLPEGLGPTVIFILGLGATVMLAVMLGITVLLEGVVVALMLGVTVTLVTKLVRATVVLLCAADSELLQ